MTPAKFVEQARVEAARCKLEQASLPIETIAEICGLRHRRAHAAILPASVERHPPGLPGAVPIRFNQMSRMIS